MAKFLGNSLATVILSLFFVAITINWLTNDDPEKNLLKPTLLKNSGESIESIDIDYVGKQIYLDVTLRKPITCKRAIEILEIGDFVVHGRTYLPTCSVINNSLIRIVYVEGVLA